MAHIIKVEPHWYNPLKSLNYRIGWTGKDFKKLQRDMAEWEGMYSKCELVDLATSHVDEILSCIRCGRIPHPENYMTCEEKGHFVCGPCVLYETTSEEEWKKQRRGLSKKELEAQKKLGELEGTCCAPNNLERGNPRILQLLLDNSTWRCPNSSKGCHAIFMGKDWSHHMRACAHQSIWHCYYFECHSICSSLQELVDHYKIRHSAEILLPTREFKSTGVFDLKFGIKCTEPEDEDDLSAFKDQRMLALLQFKDVLFIFSCELQDKVFHMLVWHLDNEVVHTLGEVKFAIHLVPPRNDEGESSDASIIKKKFTNGKTFPYSKYPPSDFTRRSSVRFADLDDHMILPLDQLLMFSLDGESEKIVNITVALKEE